MMLSRRAFFLFLFLTVFAHRVLMTSLRNFSGALVNHALASTIPGLLSDLAFCFLIHAFILVGSSRREGYAPKSLACVGQVFVIIFTALFFAAHLRLVEHFGWSLHPDQLGLVKSATSARMGLRLFFDSWRVWFMLILPVSFIFGFKGYQRPPTTGPSSPVWSSYAFAVLAIICFVGSESLANAWHSHAELHRTPVFQIAWNIRDYSQANPDLNSFDDNDLKTLRSNFSAQRSWSDPKQHLPFFQTKVYQGHAVDAKTEALRTKLIAYIEREAKEKGPWNVIIVQQESFRAHEVAAFGTAAEPRYLHATPNLSRIFAKNIRFTSVIATGNLTHYGELATACSLYSTPYHNQLFDSPNAPLVCLSDILAKEGYQTFFACGTDGQTNSRKVFYPKHNIGQFLSLEDGLPKVKRDAWGLPDSVVFSALADQLVGTKSPFFLHLLTLSNHIPRDIPADMPPELIKQASPNDRRELLVRYVDWAFGRFYDRIERELPHTLVWFTADHGEWPDIGYPQDHPTEADIRMYSRIPVGLLIPGLPAELAGSEVNRLASDVDAAPTLLDLLGLTNHPNQFMGEPIFHRQEEIVVKWGDAWRKVASDAEHPNAPFVISPEWSVSERRLWSTPGKLELLAPLMHELQVSK